MTFQASRGRHQRCPRLMSSKPGVPTGYSVHADYWSSPSSSKLVNNLRPESGSNPSRAHQTGDFSASSLAQRFERREKITKYFSSLPSRQARWLETSDEAPNPRFCGSHRYDQGGAPSNDSTVSFSVRRPGKRVAGQVGSKISITCLTIICNGFEERPRAFPIPASMVE